MADASRRLLPGLSQPVIRTPRTPFIGPPGTQDMSILIKGEHLQSWLLPSKPRLVAAGWTREG